MTRSNAAPLITLFVAAATSAAVLISDALVTGAARIPELDPAQGTGAATLVVGALVVAASGLRRRWE